MFQGIRIVHSKLISSVVLTTILTMVIGLSAARAQSTAGTTTTVTGVTKPVPPQDKPGAHPGTSLTLGLSGTPTVGGKLTAFDSKNCDKSNNGDCCDENDNDCKHHKKHSPDK